MLTDWLIWLDYLEENNCNTSFLRLVTPIIFGIKKCHKHIYRILSLETMDDWIALRYGDGYGSGFGNGNGYGYGSSDGDGEFHVFVDDED